MDTPEQLVQKRIAELPPYVKQAIGEAQATVKLRDIGLRHKLRIDQQTVMEREVMLVMLGFDTEATFVRNLVAEAKIPLPDAQKLAEEIGSEIFSHIRDAMRRMTEEKSPTKKPEPGASVPPPAKPPIQKPTAPAAAPPVIKVERPPQQETPRPAAPSVPPLAPAPSPEALESVSKALSATQSAPGTAAHIGLPTPPSPQGYKADPYREPLE